MSAKRAHKSAKKPCKSATKRTKRCLHTRLLKNYSIALPTSAKEPYIPAKGPQKNPMSPQKSRINLHPSTSWHHTKLLHNYSMSLGVSTKEPYFSAKESYISTKRNTSPQKSPISPQKSLVNLQQNKTFVARACWHNSKMMRNYSISLSVSAKEP